MPTKYAPKKPLGAPAAARLTTALLLAGGFKWYILGTTDACEADSIRNVSIVGDTLTVTYKPGTLLRPIVFSRSVARFTRIELPDDPREQYAFVHLRSRADVQHYGRDGKPM